MASARPSSSSRIKKQDSPQTTITPQRKHRKLLKDGSGTEVWPESIENVFVQGLREYWESPYAAYSQSRGRSRWRNQFLVDYLGKQGIERSKKQVASHIQVLRNMWKGEPEFHLVAGGDELYPDSGSPAPVKVEDRWDNNPLIPFDWDDADLPPSNSVSPDFSPADSQSEFPPTPEHRPNLYPSDYGAVHSKPQVMPLDSSYSTGLNSPSISPHGNYIQTLSPYHEPSPFTVLAQPKYQTNALSAHSPIVPLPAQRLSSADTALMRRHSAAPTHHRHQRNKVTTLFLSADGMSPFTIKVDALAHPSQPVHPPFTLRVRLSVPTMNDARSPTALHGFLSAISLENVWSVTGRCVTKVHTNNNCILEETGYLDITHINVGTVNATLPESPLSRSRWIDASLSVVITQEIIVDDETLLYMVYELDRRNGPMPGAMLLGYQKFRATDKATPISVPIPSTSSTSPPHAMPFGRSPTQASVPYALAPMRYSNAIPPNF